MTQWNYCPECREALVSDSSGRPSCPNGHFTKYPTPKATTIALIRNNSEYLVIKRSHEPRKGYWDLPGGFVEPDETSLQALLREVDEETKLRVEPVKYLGSYPSVYGNTGENTLGAAYVFEATNRDVVLSEENNEFRWVRLEAMPELAFDDCKKAVEDLKNLNT